MSKTFIPAAEHWLLGWQRLRVPTTEFPWCILGVQTDSDAPQWWDKTAFMTELASYLYMVMPFGLKNVCATYQCLMDRILAPMLGRNVQAYIDDMVVTSKEKKKHVTDLEELFATIGKYNLMLNPEKCGFGVEAGKFLGFMLTERGIEANPGKCVTLIEMMSLATVKEVQQLTGRMAALSRFLSASGDKGYLYFQCLKKNNCFVWTSKCEDLSSSWRSTWPVLLCSVNQWRASLFACTFPSQTRQLAQW